jgi:hypothetical protein
LDNVNNTIQGEGVIYNNGATLINEAGGTINANSTGSPLITPLYVEDGNITNGGTLEASNSGVLQLYSNTINNAGGNITASGAGATVQVYDSTIQGGTLNNSTGGTMETIGTSVLDGSTQGVLTLSAGSTYTTSTGYTTYVLGTINNQGNFQVNGGGGSDTYLRTEDNTTLQGGGTVTLSTTTTGGGGYARLYNNGGYTLDNLNNTIQGEGVIYNNGATLINEAGGVINANSTGGALSNTLSIQDGNITNSGSMEATNNGVLQLYATTVNNAGGNITANAGATVQIFGGADIQGGTLTNNGAFLGTPQNNQAILDGSTGAGAVTINGTYTSALSTQTYLLGTINNQGNIQVNGGSGASTYLWVDSSNVTLTGGGTVTLSSAAGGGSANINQTAGGYTLTNLDNTIQGVGTINVANVTNSGTIIAGTAGNPGTINIIGNYTQTGTGIYNELIGSSTSNGLLNISGLATLGSGSGTGLNISLLNNYDPASGSTFTIMNYGSLASGSALNINPADLNFGPGNDQQWLISYNGNNVVLTAESLVPGTVTATWTTGTGSWTTASQWSCVPGPSTCVPGNGGGTVYDTGLNAPGNTLTLPTGNSITVDTLALQGGTLTIQSGASLDLANQPAGITDIPSAAGLIVAGSFTTTGGTTSALAGLTSVEGYLELDGQTITDTPGGTPPTLTVASGAYAWLSGTNLTVNGNVANSGDTRVNGGSTLTVNGDLTNSHYLFTGVGGSGDTLTVSGTLTNNAGGSTWIGYNGAGGDVANVNALANNGYLYIGSGATLNITGGGQGVTDVVAGSSLNLYGTFELSGNPSQSALGNLTNVEGFMLLGNGQNISVTPGGSPATLTLASNGYVQVRYGTDWTVNGTVNNAGNLYLYDSGTTANFTALTNTGTTYISPGTTLNLTNGITDMPGQLYVYGTINSGGSSALAGLTSVEGGLYLANGQTLSITPGGSPATLTNSGVFAIGGGTNVTVNGNVNNSYDFSTDYNVGGGGNTLNVTGTFNNNAGQFLVWGPGDQATVNALNNAASAYVQVNQGATLTSNTTLNNAGYIYLYNGTTLNVNGAGTSSNSGNVYLYGGTLAGNNASANFNNTGLISTQGGPSQPSTLNFAGTFTNGPGGTLNLNYSGDQATTPTLGNGGTVTVASGALLGVGTGTFAAGGGFQQLANGTLNEIIQNTSPSGFGILNITGPVSLAGALNVTLLSGFDPTGDTFDILNYTGSLTGAFTNGTLFTADGYQWTLTYGSGDVLLSAGAIPGLVAATWSAGSGNWTNALQWGCNPVYAPCVPNNNGVTAFTATLDSPGQTLALDSTSTPTSITIDSLSLVAGTLDIGSGATLNLANRPGGITDIPSAAGLIVAGTFTAGANSALVGLTSVEGYVELDNAQTTAVTPGGSPATLTVASGGDLRVNNGSTLTVNGNLTNSGDVYTGVGYTAGNTLTVSGAYTNNGLTYEGYSNTSDLVNVGSLTNNGELVIDPNATFNITGGGQGITDAVAGSTLYLYGTFELGGNPSQSALGNLTSVEGYVELDNAQTTATAPNGGTLTVASTGDLRVNNGSTLTVTGNLTNSGLIYTGVGYSAGNTLNVSGAFTNNLDASTYVGYNSSADQMNVGSLANAGYIQVDNGSSLNIAGSTDTNSGTIALYGATLSSPSPSGNFDNTGTVRTISGPASTVAIGGTFTNEAGANLTLNNSGDVAKIGNLANGGTVTVAAGALLGVGTGTFTATSGFQQLSSGTLTELIGSASSWGVLNITGPVSLAGALNITLLNSFDPTGNTFDILNYTGTLTGAFSNGTNFSADGYNWTLTYGTGDVLLTAGAIPGLVAATWSTGSGNWTNTAEWGCNPTYSPCMPNNTSPTAFTAEIDSPGQTLALNGSSSPMSITINSLSLVAGTLDIGTGTTLNLANQPSGIMDIPLGAGLDVAGTFTAGANSALANLGSVEGTLTLESQTLTATPGTPPFSNSGAMNLQQTTALTISGDLSNSGTINTGNGASDTGSNSLAVSGTLTNSGNIYMHGVGDSLSADLTNSGNIELLANNQTLTDTGDFNNTGGLLSLTGNTDTVTVAGNLTNTGTVQMLGTNGSIAVTLGLSNSGDIYIGAGGGNKLTMGTWNNLSGSGNLTGGGHYDIGGLFEYSAPANGITSIGSGVEVTLRPGGLITPDGTTDALAGLASNAGELELVNHSESFTPAGSPGTFSNSGNLYLSNNSSSATLTVNGNFHNSGLTQLYGSAAQGLSVTGNSSNEGTIAMYGPGDSFSTAGTLTNSGTIGMYGTGESLSADLTNTGAINLNGNNDMLTDTEDFNNNSGGSLHLTADLNSVSVSGNFNNNSGASVTMSGTNGSISVLGAGGFTNGGSVSLTGSHDTLNAASFANTGNVAIGATETVSVGAGAGTYTQTAGTTRGTGTIVAGNVNINGGTIQPGAPGAPGTLAITGNYTQGSGGTLIIDLGGTGAGQFSLLNLSGNAMLDGTVDFALVGGFTPTAGEDFTFLTWGGTESGNFANMDFTNWSCPAGDTCTDVLGSNSLTLEINGPTIPPTSTPEPSVFLLLAMGIALMSILLKYRNTLRSTVE